MIDMGQGWSKLCQGIPPSNRPHMGPEQHWVVENKKTILPVWSMPFARFHVDPCGSRNPRVDSSAPGPLRLGVVRTPLFSFRHVTTGVTLTLEARGRECHESIWELWVILQIVWPYIAIYFILFLWIFLLGLWLYVWVS